jgi:hypothetical protein
MTSRQTESLVRRLREESSDEGRAALLDGYAEARAPWPGVDAAKPGGRPRSEIEQLMADVATLMRVGVRVEVRLLDAPVCVEGAESARHALDELSALLATLAMAIGRALRLRQQVEKMDATLAHP